MAFADILKKVFGSKSDRDMKLVKPILNRILESNEVPDVSAWEDITEQVFLTD